MNVVVLNVVAPTGEINWLEEIYVHFVDELRTKKNLGWSVKKRSR
jgi:hypothetical protein